MQDEIINLSHELGHVIDSYCMSYTTVSAIWCMAIFSSHIDRVLLTSYKNHEIGNYKLHDHVQVNLYTLHVLTLHVST